MKDPTAPAIYPDLRDDHSFRVNLIVQQFEKLEAECERIRIKHIKYMRHENACRKIAYTFGVVAVSLGGSGIATGLTVVGIPLSAGLGAGAVACTIAGSIATKMISYYTPKARKYEQMLEGLKTLLSSLKGTVSQALDDGSITHQEYEQFRTQVKQYNEQREQKKE